MNIRNAESIEHSILTNMAIRSKSFWGYSSDFINKCIQDLTITHKYIDENMVRVLIEENKILGFYAYSYDENKLDALFVDPQYIGDGYGKTLWKDLLNELNHINIRSFTLESEPHAKNFYIKMGMKEIGEVESTVFPGRKLPLMKYIIN